MRTIKTCPGIGDTLFLFQKLINQPERFNWKIWDGMKNGQQAQPQRGHQIFELFPQLVESFEYIPNAGYNKIKRDGYSGSWSTAPKGEFVLEANSHLESGKPIDSFLPDLPTSYLLPFPEGEEMEIDTSKKLIGIYTTSYANAQYMSGWLIREWKSFIELLHAHDSDFHFVFIGAPYDGGLSQEIMKLIPSDWFTDLMGKTTLLQITWLLRKLHCFVGFQSGLMIMSELMGARQTTMLYSPALKDMMNTWPDPKRIESGSYKGCVFGEVDRYGALKHLLTPEGLFDWLKENNKL